MVGGESYAEALEASEEWVRHSEAMAVHAFDQEETLLGQGTLAASSWRRRRRSWRRCWSRSAAAGCWGESPAGTAAGSDWSGWSPRPRHPHLRAGGGRPVDAEVGSIAADSLAPRRIGERPFPILQETVAEVILVTDDEIRAAQRKIWELLRVVAEPGGAAAFGALLARKVQPPPGGRVGIVVSGGNTTAVDFGR